MRKFETVLPEHMKNNMAVIPSRSSKGSAGYDLYATETVTFYPGQKHMFWLNIKAMMDEDDVLLIFPRSSMGVKGFRLANTVGVIDASYYSNKDNDGNIGVCLIYAPTSEERKNYTIEAGDRIAQAVFTKYGVTEDDAADGERTGGFGSSGV